MFFRLTTLTTWRNFSQTKPKKTPKMKENSETGYVFSAKIPEPLEGEGNYQSLTRSPPPGDHQTVKVPYHVMDYTMYCVS